MARRPRLPRLASRDCPQRRGEGIESLHPRCTVATQRPLHRATAGQVPIAGGEQEFRPDVWETVPPPPFDIYQPDLGYSGGVSQARCQVWPQCDESPTE